MTAIPEREPAPITTSGSAARRPRRAPNPDERRRDAERSRQALMNAALDEFAEKGFDGARIQDIADRAGVNKQLIAYYFGGKEGLYQEVQRSWPEIEAEFADPALPLDEVAVRYLSAGLADTRPARLMIWRGLTGDDTDIYDDETTVEADLANLRHAQERGEIAADLDPAFVRMAVMGMVLAPVMLPRTILRSTGTEPDSPEFEHYCREQLRRLMRHLAAPDTPGK
jgi:TetR/AcrR family transcriptional regulator